MSARLCTAKFRVGRIVATANAVRQLSQEDVLMALSRHQSGDWGDVNAHDRTANEQALRSGLRLLSAYMSSTGSRFWIITEADRSMTTVLMPEDY